MDQQQQVDHDPNKQRPNSKEEGEKGTEFAPYPKVDTSDLTPPPPYPSSSEVERPHDPSPKSSAPATPGGGSSHKSVSWSTNLTQEMPAASSNPYIDRDPVAPSNKVSMDKVKDMLGRWGKKAKEAAKKTEDYAGNVWQHLKTGPSVADAAMGRIAHSTKVIAEGGYEKIFRNTFETFPDENLKKSFACYLSTSAGPVMGTLYVSTAKLAFCSDNPLSYKADDKTEWSYYKVVIPLHQLRSVTPTKSKVNSSEKYIQVVSVDSHEFWFMGFVNYDGAVKLLQEASFEQRAES